MPDGAGAEQAGEAEPERAGIPWRAASVVVAVLAVLSGTAFAYVSVATPDGAPTPEAAVEQLFAAIEAGDATGVIESLPARERDLILDPVQDIVGELHR